MTKYRAGIVGLGHQSRSDHIPGVQNSRLSELVALCDVNSDSVNRLGKELDVNAYTSVNDMLEHENLDFVVIATPHNTHHDIVRTAAENNVHVLKEKPLARTIDEANFIKDSAAENNIQVMVTLQRRFNPIYTTFFQLKDQVGSPYYIDARYHLSIDNPHEGWRGSKEISGGGCIIDMGYHMIDMLIWYFGLPDKVHAEFSSRAIPNEDYDAEDTANIMFRYDAEGKEMHGNLFLSRCCQPKTETIKLIGTEGVVYLERGMVQRLDRDGNTIESLTRERSWPTASTNQIDYFCRILDGKTKNFGDPSSHLNHVRFIEACYDSQKQEKYINPKLSNNDNGQ